MTIENTKAGIRIIGVGNFHRGDDGVGIEVARRLHFDPSLNVEVIEASGEGVALLDMFKEAGTLILIDAVRSGSEPGTIHRLDPREKEIPSSFFHYSSHAFGVAEAVELARALNQLPPRLVIYGIEGKDFSAGAELSAEVARAAGEVVARIQDDFSPATKG